MGLVKACLFVLSVYVLVVGGLAALQRWLIFPNWAMGDYSVPLPAAASPLAIERDNGARLVGARLPPAAPPPDDPVTVIGFGGNASNADDLLVHLHRLLPAAAVVVFHYRGYRPSTGSPGAEALLADGVRIHDHVAARFRPRRVVLAGFSLGAGVAAYVASQRRVTGLIMGTPFDSLEALGRDRYPWAPVGLLLRHRIPVTRFMAGQRTPTAIIAAGADAIVPPRRTDALRPHVENLVMDRTLDGAGHNDLFDHPAFPAALSEALARVVAAPAPGRIAP